MRTVAKERDTLRAIMDLLAYEHIWAMRINTAAQILVDANGNRRFLQSHSAGRGVADILALVEIEGGFMPLWCECKSASGHQTPEQKSFQQDVERRGHSYIVARSVDDVIQALKEIRKCTIR